MGKWHGGWAIAALMASLLPAQFATASQTQWPALMERSFSPEVAEFVRPAPAFEYRAFKEGDVQLVEKLKAEVAACLSEGPIQPCVGMVLDGRNWIDDLAKVEEAMAAAERMFPVDMLVVPGDQRIAGPKETVLGGLRRLDKIATISADLHGGDDQRTIRRQLGYDIALWRVGAARVPALESVERVHGPNGEVTGRAKALAATAHEWVTQAPTWAADAHRVLAGEAASVVAARQLKLGNYEAAEQLAFDGYAAVSAARGQDHPATIAAAAILAKSYSERGKKDLALPLARRVLEAREVDEYASTTQRLEAVMAVAELVPASDREPLLRRALALVESSLGKPQWPIAAQLAREVDDGGLTFSNGVGIAESAAMVRDEAGERALLDVKSRIYTSMGADVMRRDPEAAKQHFKAAIAANSSNRMPGYLLAAVTIGTARELTDLHIDGMNIEALFAEMGESRNFPDDHPERILQGLLAASYYIRWNARYAPEHARKAATGAAKRIGSHETLDEQALSELSQLKGVFATQVQSNWAAQQSR